MKKARHSSSFRGLVLTCPKISPEEAPSRGVMLSSGAKLVLMSRPAQAREEGGWLMRDSGWFTPGRVGGHCRVEGTWGTAEAEGRVEDLKPCEQCMATQHQVHDPWRYSVVNSKPIALPRG